MVHGASLYSIKQGGFAIHSLARQQVYAKNHPMRYLYE